MGGHSVDIDISLIWKDLQQSASVARDADAAGFDGVWATEAANDPFLQSYAAIANTRTAVVGTAIVVAFARTPMTVAYPSWDLAAASGGRFRLGLGTQVRAHIERRFSMPWSDPVERMRDYVAALHAIWACWRDGTPLDHRGAYYRHALMTPVFTPARHEHPVPISLAAVGPRMTRLVGEVADGLIVHGFMNQPYFDQVTVPALARGLRASARARDDLEVFLPAFMIMGDTEQQLGAMRDKIREQVAFYGSTPSYRPVLEAVGYGDLQEDLTTLSKRGAWEAMAALVTDELVECFALTGAPEDMPRLVRERWSGRVDRVSSYYGWPVDDPDRLRAIVAAFHAAPLG